MITRDQVDELEALIGQLFSLHNEMAVLTKKSSTDAVNKFKLRFINAAIDRCNRLLGDKYRPFSDFAQFDGDDVPSNSDVTLMLGQYQEALEYFRSENIKQVHGSWYYVIEDEGASVRTSPPVRLTTRE